MESSFIRTTFRAAIATAMVWLVTEAAFAGGFSIYEQGARATAQGGAFVARPWDASAGFYNPAGLAMFGKPGQWRIYGGATPLQVSAKFRGANPYPGTAVSEKAKTKWFPPVNLYGSYQVNDKVNVALAVTTPFGLGTEWPEEYSGRFRSILGTVQAIFVSPTVSYKVNDQLSFGAAVDYIWSSVELKRRQAQTYFNGSGTSLYDVAEVELTGTDGASFGWHLGALYKFNDQWSIGVDYKHLVHQEYEGDAEFTILPTGNPVIDNSVNATFSNPAFGGLKQDGNAKYLNFPNSIVVGVGYKAEKWNAELDFAYVGWSTFKQIQIEFPDNASLTSSLEQNYDNSWQIRAGFEYWLSEKFAGRCGYIFDKTPAPANTISPLLPDSDRHDLSIGFGYKFTDALSVDAAYMAVLFTERSTKNNVDKFDGRYAPRVNLFSIGVGYSFGGQ